MGNASPISRMLRALLRVWRRGGLVRTVIMVGICGLLLGGVPMPAQEMARFFLAQLYEDWASRHDEVARAAVELAPLAVHLAELRTPASEAGGRALGEAIRAARVALFTFALADRLDRRRERDAA